MKEGGKGRKLWSKRAEFVEPHIDMDAYFRERRERERDKDDWNKKFVCLERKKIRWREKK